MTKLLSREDLAARGIRLNKATLWRKVRDGQFPRPILVGNRHAWPEHEIDAYVETLIAKRDATAEAA
jgi:predicted DNA-binding transcriptional regulator AlpA